MKPRLYISPDNLPATNENIHLSSQLSHYVCQVLRLKSGDAVQVFDGLGKRYDTTVMVANKRSAILNGLVSVAGTSSNRHIKLTLVQGVARADRMDWVVEKATELGVARIIPLLAERSTVRLDAGRARKRYEHWRRVSESACMQCGLDSLPEIALPCNLIVALEYNAAAQTNNNNQRHLVHLCPSAELTLSNWAARQASIRQAGRNRSGATDDALWPNQGNVTVFVGPESGFSPSEEKVLQDAGALPVSIGPRILRTETAGIVAMSLLQGLIGDLR